MALTTSEALVEQLAATSFLTLWSYPNPRRSDGKELCDLLVVCDPDVILFSVKAIGLSDPNDQVAIGRWQKRAVLDSVKQLYGAARHLGRLRRVLRSDGTEGFSLPPPDRIRIHRVAVALGSEGKVVLEQRDFGKGFVHVLGDLSLKVVLEELDTVSDFVAYLSAKEELVSRGVTPIARGGERDLLAIYLHRGRQFPTDQSSPVITEGVWHALSAKSEWHRRKQEDRVSYLWDQLIEGVSRDILGPGLEFGTPDQGEGVVRIMARENRFSRRILSESFLDFMQLAIQEKTRARIAESPAGVTYVFLAGARDEPRDTRVKELGLRCIVARSRQHAYAPVVGLGTERWKRGSGYSLDAVLVDIPDWSNEDQVKADQMSRELGYFVNPDFAKAHFDEFPSDRAVSS